MDALRLDVRYALRALRARPFFSSLAILTLAIGIGVNLVAFTAINSLLFKPLRFEGAEQLGWIAVRSAGNVYGKASLPDYQDLARSATTFEALIAEARMPFSMRRDGIAEQTWGLLVSTNYLPAMRVRPALGRLLTPDDLRGSELPVIVSQRFWNETLGGGDSVAGRTLVLNGRSFSIVGVIPDTFQGPGGLYEPDLWLPLERIDVLSLAPSLRARETEWLSLVGRLKPSATAAEGTAELQALISQLPAATSAPRRERRIEFAPMTGQHPEFRGIAAYVWIALGVVGLVLLIACFNVAGLLLARASERQREIGVRAALGSSRARILRQLVTEGAILALLSTAAALVAATWTADLLSAFSLPSPIPQRLHMALDFRLVAFTAALASIAAVLPALIPALQASGKNVLDAIRRQPMSAGTRSLARNIFVVAQVAGSTLFLAAALLFVRSFLHTAAFDPGFDTVRTLVLELNPSTYGYDAPRSTAFFGSLVERLSAAPGLSHVAIADKVPFSVGFPKTSEVSVTGEDCVTAKCRTATEYAVGTNYFAALGIPLRAGREFTELDLQRDAAVVINETMARRLWPDGGAVGRRFTFGRREVDVIGVAADIKHHTMGERPASYVYRPLRPEDFGDRITLVVRAAGDPHPLIKTVQSEIQALDPSLPATGVKTMAQRMELPLWPARTAAGFFLICGTLALVLATVGLFGVMWYAVGQRTREFGVRVALGATSGNVLRLVIREGLMLAGPGVLLGILGALAVARLVASALFGVSYADPFSFAVTAALQTLVTVAACAIPAHRATRIDPMLALRAD